MFLIMISALKRYGIQIHHEMDTLLHFNFDDILILFLTAEPLYHQIFRNL